MINVLRYSDYLIFAAKIVIYILAPRLPLQNVPDLCPQFLLRIKQIKHHSQTLRMHFFFSVNITNAYAILMERDKNKEFS